MPFSHPPTVAGFFMPFPRGGYSAILSGLFFGGILFHQATLSACVALLVSTQHGRRIIPLLQGRYKPRTSSFPGVAKLHRARDFVPPWTAWRGRGGIGPGGSWVAAQGVDPPIWAGYGRGGGPGERCIVADRFQNFIVAAKVAEKSPESRKTSGGIFIVAIVAWSKSLAYFDSSASMILSASAPYTSSRYFLRSSSGSFRSPRGLSGFKTTSCWSV